MTADVPTDLPCLRCSAGGRAFPFSDEDLFPCCIGRGEWFIISLRKEISTGERERYNRKRAARGDRRPR